MLGPFLAIQHSPTAIDGEEVEDHSGVCAARTESEEQKKRTPPSGGVARAREEGEALYDEIDRRQPSLLLPIKGGRERKARLAVIKNYNPSPALIELVAESGVNVLAEDVLGRWQCHRIATDRLPLDFEAAEADFRKLDPRRGALPETRRRAGPGQTAAQHPGRG